MTIISLDTETTGVDFVHGAKPFLVTTCDDKGVIRYWEWPVDPLTRCPSIGKEDIVEITQLMESAELIYLQNSKFDCRALRSIGLYLPWHKVRDTLIAGHLLASNHGHSLDEMVLEYLGYDINPQEAFVKEVTQAVRVIVKRCFPQWKIAKEGEEDMPSVKAGSKRDEDKPWKNDMWLTRALYSYSPDKIPHKDHERWLDACAEYANTDSECTILLGLELEKLIRERGYWPHYEHRLKLMQVDCEMEMYGTTLIGEYTQDNIDNYERYSAEVGAELVCMASEYGHDLELAQGASINDNMREFFYGSKQLRCPRCGLVKRIKHWNGEDTVESGSYCPKCAKSTKRKQGVNQAMALIERPNLALPVIVGAKTGNASLDKSAMNEYLSTLEGDQLEFIRLLLDKRKHDTDLMYMQMYQRYWVPVAGAPGFFRIHPSINPCGTDHLRQSCNSPNLQNVGGQEDKCGECGGAGCDWCNGTGKTRSSLKNCFGPATGREWYSMDYKSIEARLPAYESMEPKQVEVFENPNAPPYWGNLYNLTASVLYADEYWPTANDEGRFRKEYPKLYKYAKFFVLAKNYGAGRAKGDALSKIKNSYDLVDREFPLLSALQNRVLKDAQRTGWVHTIPSRAIDPSKGYPILASRTEDNYILSTTPFNYHISGTACECKNLALVRCAAKLAEWRQDGFDGYMALEIHDEILFDFPRGKSDDSNVHRALELKALMEESGEDLIPRIPTPVKVEYHTRTWAEGVGI